MGSDSFKGERPPSPPRLRSTSLPDDSDGRAFEQEPFLHGHPILPEDMAIGDLPDNELHKMNQIILEEIKNMESGRPLISEPEPISVLCKEYSDSQSPNFLAQIDTLIKQGYNTIIRVKGDGDCFYRALAYAYLDRLSRSPERDERLTATKLILSAARFEESVFGEPYEIIESCPGDRLFDMFRDPATSNYVVMYMRLLTSAQLRFGGQYTSFLTDPELQNGISVDEFCRQSVEPLGKEADSVQVAALTQALGVSVKVAYVDGRAADGHVNFLEFPSKDAETLVLLYRPGHYDILQKRR